MKSPLQKSFYRTSPLQEGAAAAKGALVAAAVLAAAFVLRGAFFFEAYAVSASPAVMMPATIMPTMWLGR